MLVFCGVVQKRRGKGGEDLPSMTDMMFAGL